MQRRTFFSTLALTAITALAAATATPALADEELRVMVHKSFVLPKPLLAQFEAEAGVKLRMIQAGDAGEMLNKLILTRAHPIADVVFGIDNTLLAKAQTAGVLDAHGVAVPRSQPQLAPQVLAVDYSYVALNYDKAAVAASGLPLPKSLEDLTQPAYRNWLVVENPATSSPGHAFLLATIAGLGEEKAFDWWAKMRANGLKVAKGWSEAYYTEFSRNGGTRPLVVGYATSPAAEVFFSKEKITESPTANLFFKGGVFRQLEGVALIKGGGQRPAAAKFLHFMRSAPVQQALQTSMWMFPLEPKTPRAEVMRHALEPASFESLPPELIAQNGSQWISRWTRVVLK